MLSRGLQNGCFLQMEHQSRVELNKPITIRILCSTASVAFHFQGVSKSPGIVNRSSNLIVLYISR